MIDTGSVISREEFDRLMAQQGTDPAGYEVVLDTTIQGEAVKARIFTKDVSVAYRIQIWLGKQIEAHGCPGQIDRRSVYREGRRI